MKPNTVPIPKVVLVYADDWEALFVDDKCVMEGHSLAAFQVLEALKISYTQLDADNEWLGELGRFGDLPLSKVKLA